MWSVQAKGEDELYRTVEGGEHENLSTAFTQYQDLSDIRQSDIASVVQLLRDDHIVIRSDRHDWNPHHESQQERATRLF